jgi:hypothetical protein
MAITRSGTAQDERRNTGPDPSNEPRHPLWGAPRVHGELLKLGIEVSQATVGRYLPRAPEGSLPDLAELFAEPYDSHRRGRHVGRRDRDV